MATKKNSPSIAQERQELLDEISCDGCGRRFMTLDGPGMLAVIKGPCPDCGGRFRLTRTEVAIADDLRDG